jgi:hypothetical protein
MFELLGIPFLLLTCSRKKLGNVGVASSISGMRGLAFSSLWIFSTLYLRSYLGLSVVRDEVIITLGTVIGVIV